MDARLERLKAIIEQTVAERDQLIEDRDRLIDEAKELMRERNELRMVLDDERAHCEEFSHENGRLAWERDVAREAARFYRDLYTTIVAVSSNPLLSSAAANPRDENPLPWEHTHADDQGVEKCGR